MKKLLDKINTDPRLYWKEHGVAMLFFMGVFCYLELMLHLVIFKSVDFRIFYLIFFSMIAGGAVYLLCSLLPEKINRWVGLAAIFGLAIYFETQLVYYCIFGSFLPVSQMTMGADAVTNFTAQVFHAIFTNFWKVLLMFLPVFAAVFLLWKKKLPSKRLTLLQIPLCAGLILALTGGTLLTMYLFDTNENSAYALLINANTSTTSCVKNLGVAVTAVQETRGFLNAKEEEGFELVFQETPLDQREAKDANVTEIDFSALETKDEKIKAINEYLAGVSPTAKNEYSGIAKGYNLITICAESFSPIFIDKELTPTLYKLSHSGLIFKNYYTGFANTTTNGEYGFCMGLMPNMSRTKVESSFDDSNSNYLPYCLGNIYKEQGLIANAYHNYFGTYYDRVISHANMGYDFKAIDAGLDMQVQWPSSDLDMVKVSMPEYVNSEKPFHAYYMTFSGHYQYDWENAMSKKNQDAVKDLPYSEPVKAYIACNLELEYALAALMEGLEKAGQADKTVIVLTGDHYPYGLTEEQYNELAGEEVDTTFERFRNAFICYIPGMEPVEIENYCSTIDILPTILNIMGIEYDSRLLAGKDALSDAPHMAILTDRSFVTKDFRYDASTGEAYYNDGSPADPEKIAEYNCYVSNLFSLSNGILETDYYAYLFGRTSDFKGAEADQYTDIDDPHMEEAVVAAVNSGLMIPDGESIFGAKRYTGSAELITALFYKNGGRSKNQSRIRRWADENNLLEDPTLWERPLTYERAAILIYRYHLELEGIKDYRPQDELKKLQKAYPDLSKESLKALRWCYEAGFFEEPFYEKAKENVTRGAIAFYLSKIN